MGCILVVDDNQDGNDVLCRLLRCFGHRPLSALSGESALTLIGADRPDLVILDVMMPGMDGLEVLRLIRADPSTSDLPVILYSGISDAAFSAHAMRKGANEFWVKGNFDLSTLQNLIGKYVPEAAAS
jgi:CheY-like chemotaxis protein